MSGSTAIPQAFIKRPRFTKTNVKEMVERLEPDRHEPDTQYQFSNGRTFKAPRTS